MSALQDAILAATGGPTVPDGLLSHYKTNGATAGALPDAEREFLLAGGAQPAQLQDMWMDALGAAGYTGAVQDRKLAFWRAGGTFGAISARPNDFIGTLALDPNWTGITFASIIPAGDIPDGSDGEIRLGAVPNSANESAVWSAAGASDGAHFRGSALAAVTSR